MRRDEWGKHKKKLAELTGIRKEHLWLGRGECATNVGMSERQFRDVFNQHTIVNSGLNYEAYDPRASKVHYRVPRQDWKPWWEPWTAVNTANADWESYQTQTSNQHRIAGTNGGRPRRS